MIYYKMKNIMTLRNLFAFFAFGVSLMLSAADADCSWKVYRNGSFQTEGSGTLLQSMSQGGSAGDSIAVTILRDINVNSSLQFPTSRVATSSYSLLNPNNCVITYAKDASYRLSATGRYYLYGVNMVFTEFSNLTSAYPAVMSLNANKLHVIGGEYAVKKTASPNYPNVLYCQTGDFLVQGAKIDMTTVSNSTTASAIRIKGASSVNIQDNTITVNRNPELLGEVFGIFVMDVCSSPIDIRYNTISVRGYTTKAIYHQGSNAMLLKGNIVVLPYLNETDDASHTSQFAVVGRINVGGLASTTFPAFITVDGGVYAGTLKTDDSCIKIIGGYYALGQQNNWMSSVVGGVTGEPQKIKQGNNTFYYVEPKDIPEGNAKYVANIYSGSTEVFPYTDYLESGVGQNFLTEARHVLEALYYYQNAYAYIDLGENVGKTTDPDDMFSYMNEEFPTNVCVKYSDDEKYYAHRIEVLDKIFYTEHDVTVSSPENLVYTRKFFAQEDSVKVLGTVCLPFNTNGVTLSDIEGEGLIRLMKVAGYDTTTNKIVLSDYDESELGLPAGTPTFLYIGNENIDKTSTSAQQDTKSASSDGMSTEDVKVDGMWETKVISSDGVLRKLELTDTLSYGFDDVNFRLVGVTDTIKFPSDGTKYKYWALNFDGTTLGWLNATQKINPFRAYVVFDEVPEAFLAWGQTSSAKRIGITSTFGVGGTTGIVSPSAEDVVDETETVDVYTASGVLVRKGVLRRDAFRGLASGAYIIGSKKFILL